MEPSFIYNSLKLNKNIYFLLLYCYCSLHCDNHITLWTNSEAEIYNTGLMVGGNPHYENIL
jgi:hypothetical protein